MANVQIKPMKLDSKWLKANERAEKGLNTIFAKNNINVTVSNKGGGPVVEVKMDANVPANMGAITNSSWELAPNVMKSATIRLRPNPKAGPGQMEAIIAHEICHALGHTKEVGGMSHSTHLMTDVQTFSGDKLVAGSVKMPPLLLSDDSIALLQGLWP